MSRVGILIFSDSHDSVHRGINFPEEGIWDLESSGQHATCFAGLSDAPARRTRCSRTRAPMPGPILSRGWTPPRRGCLPGSGRTTSTLSRVT